MTENELQNALVKAYLIYAAPNNTDKVNINKL